MNDVNQTAPDETKETSANSKNDIAARAKSTIEKITARASNKGKTSDDLSGIVEKDNQKSNDSQEFFDAGIDTKNKNARQSIKDQNQTIQPTANASSEYVKNFDLAETSRQIKETIKQKPGFIIIIAGIFVLLIGLLVGRKTGS